jgi:hypothetical protein
MSHRSGLRGVDRPLRNRERHSPRVRNPPLHLFRAALQWIARGRESTNKPKKV